MANFRNRPHLENRQMVQHSGAILNLSGQTFFEQGLYDTYFYNSYEDFLNGISGGTGYLNLIATSGSSIDAVSGYSNHISYIPGKLTLKPARGVVFSGNTNIVSGYTAAPNVTGYIVTSIDSNGTMVWTPLSAITSDSCVPSFSVQTIVPCSSGGTVTVDGNFKVEGNFTVIGTTTSATTIIETETVRVEDNNIELNYGGNHTTAIGGGITVLSGVSNSQDSRIYTLSDGTFMFEPGISATTGIYWEQGGIGNSALKDDKGGHTLNGSVSNGIIAGGFGNTLDDSTYSFMGGGLGNTIEGSSDRGSIVGGFNNTMTNGTDLSSIISGEENTIDGSDIAGIFAGSGNTIDGASDRSTIIAGIGNVVEGASNDSGIFVGSYNTIDDSDRVVILGGDTNGLYGSDNSSIVGGDSNVINTSTESFIGGGKDNTMNGERSVILGGLQNTITGHTDGAIIGGTGNTIDFCLGSYGPTSSSGEFILGGFDNLVHNSEGSGIIGSTNSGLYEGTNSVMMATSGSTMVNKRSVLLGGFNNTISSTDGFYQGILSLGYSDVDLGYGASSIIGGLGNANYGSFTSIIGGVDNEINADCSVGGSSIIGGHLNTISGDTWSSIIGGQNNKILDGAIINQDENSIIGGDGNTISGSTKSFIGGGEDNVIAGGIRSVIGGGKDNTLNGERSVILGGLQNTISGHLDSAILGGSGNTIDFGFVLPEYRAESIIASDDSRIVGAGRSLIGASKDSAITATTESAILGTQNSTMTQSRYSVILGGENHVMGAVFEQQGMAIIGGNGNFLNSDNSVILGGQNITGTTSNTVYVPNLNIGTLGVGTSVNNLGIDTSGNVVVGSAGGSGGVTIDPYNDLGNVNTTQTWDVSGTSTNYELTLTGSITLNLNNVRNGDYGTLIVEQDGVGSHTLAFGTVNGGAGTHKVVNGGGGSPTLTSTPNAIDLLSFTYNGTTMYWSVGNDYT